MNPDPEGPKTNRSYGSGSATLVYSRSEEVEKNDLRNKILILPLNPKNGVGPDDV
jgi:hypothetical protein